MGRTSIFSSTVKDFDSSILPVSCTCYTKPKNNSRRKDDDMIRIDKKDRSLKWNSNFDALEDSHLHEFSKKRNNDHIIKENSSRSSSRSRKSGKILIII